MEFGPKNVVSKLCLDMLYIAVAYRVSSSKQDNVSGQMK